MGLEGDSLRSRPPFRVHNCASIDAPIVNPHIMHCSCIARNRICRAMRLSRGLGCSEGVVRRSVLVKRQRSALFSKRYGVNRISKRKGGKRSNQATQRNRTYHSGARAGVTSASFRETSGSSCMLIRTVQTGLSASTIPIADAPFIVTPSTRWTKRGTGSGKSSSVIRDWMSWTRSTTGT